MRRNADITVNLAQVINTDSIADSMLVCLFHVVIATGSSAHARCRSLCLLVPHKILHCTLLHLMEASLSWSVFIKSHRRNYSCRERKRNRQEIVRKMNQVHSLYVHSLSVQTVGNKLSASCPYLLCASPFALVSSWQDKSPANQNNGVWP